MVYIMNRDEALKLLDLPFLDLVSMADEERRKNAGEGISLCGIVNAKSGVCPEDCKFCAQSVHHKTKIEAYPLLGRDNIVREAFKAQKNGAERFGIVTSGNRLSSNEIDAVSSAIKEILDRTNLSVCASLGALDEGSFLKLKMAGLKRYHHNVETSPDFYPNIVSTHKYSERINTINLAKKHGFEVCSGGIIGLGESWKDRIDMAFVLKALDVDSIPLNFLVPIKGTPLEEAPVLSAQDAIRTIAIFRLINPGKAIRVAAGRETVLKDYEALMFMAGANGMMIGGYLTIAGRSVKEDTELVSGVRDIWKTG